MSVIRVPRKPSIWSVLVPALLIGFGLGSLVALLLA
jgi:hypothetical protein